MERRDTDRVPGWAQARIKKNGTITIALALNLSSRGLCIESGSSFIEGEELKISLHLPDAVDPEIVAEVVWVSNVGNHVPGLPYRIGLRIVEMEHFEQEEFTRFLDRFSKHSFEMSRLARIEVVIEGRRDIQKPRLYTLFNGGCFLCVEEGLPEVDDEFEISLFIPTSPNPFTFLARVAYVIRDAESRSLGIERGFGLQFLEEKGGVSKALVAYLGKNEPVFEKTRS